MITKKWELASWFKSRLLFKQIIFLLAFLLVFCFKWLLLVFIMTMVWFIWTVCHELSHVIAASFFRKLTRLEFFLWPHVFEDKFYFARTQFWWQEKGLLRGWEQAVVSFAPRLLDFVAAVCFPAFGLFAWPLNLFWGLFWFGGLLDLLIGSLGISSYSDLKKASSAIQVNVWVFRLIGIFVFLISVSCGIMLL